MDYKLCILAAGKGTRNRYALNSNKALLPLGEGTALSYIIGKFPKDIKIVIAIGYNAEMVIKYALQWGDRVEFVYVNYEGDKRGPGYSLFQCSPSLHCPFIYIACDTIVTDDIPEPTRNWLGITFVDIREPYLTVDLGKGGKVRKIYDKGDKNATYLASIGLVGVKDYEDFWEGLAHPNKVQGEIQDSPGLRALIKKGLFMESFHWLDIGTTEGYEYAQQRFSKTIS